MGKCDREVDVRRGHHQNDLIKRPDEPDAHLNLGEIWAEATDQERRVLVEELLDVVAIFPDHLDVTVKNAPRLKRDAR